MILQLSEKDSAKIYIYRNNLVTSNFVSILNSFEANNVVVTGLSFYGGEPPNWIGDILWIYMTGANKA